jgi:hypothetical protein
MPYHFSKWRDAIHVARDERSIVGVIQDYLATIEPETLEAVSEESRRVLSERPLDLQTAAVLLLHEELRHRGDPKVGAALHEIAHTLSAASVRLASLGVEPSTYTGDDHAFRGGVSS